MREILPDLLFEDLAPGLMLRWQGDSHSSTPDKQNGVQFKSEQNGTWVSMERNRIQTHRDQKEPPAAGKVNQNGMETHA